MGLFAIELAIPIWAERAGRSPWHPEHITERYGLFTIIVLGESIFSASLAVTSLTVAGLTIELLGILFGGLVIVFVMWWLYFERPVRERTTMREGFTWGYGHLPIWAAAAAVGAGLAVAIEQATGQGALDAVSAGYAVTIPVAIYLAGIWFIHELAQVETWRDAVPALVTIGALLVVPLTGWGVLLGGVVVSALLAYKLVTGRIPSAASRSTGRLSDYSIANQARTRRVTVRSPVATSVGVPTPSAMAAIARILGSGPTPAPASSSMRATAPNVTPAAVASASALARAAVKAATRAWCSAAEGSDALISAPRTSFAPAATTPSSTSPRRFRSRTLTVIWRVTR